MAKAADSKYGQRVIPADAETAVCRECGDEKPIRQFLKASRQNGACRIQPCQKCNYRRYRKTYARSSKRYREEKRAVAIAHYGGACACCGETRDYFLTIDHVDGGGNEHRRSDGFHSIFWWLFRNGYPDGFQVLCANCHLAKTKLGACLCQTSSLQSPRSKRGATVARRSSTPGASEPKAA